MSNNTEITHFAPELHIPNGTIEIDFYINFGASEIFCFRNDDGSIHVAELEINGAIFHVHETMRDALEPVSAKGVTCIIGLFVLNVEEVMHKAIQAGAIEIHPTTDYDYGYRQGMFKDPFGHYCKYRKKYNSCTNIKINKYGKQIPHKTNHLRSVPISRLIYFGIFYI